MKQYFQLSKALNGANFSLPKMQHQLLDAKLPWVFIYPRCAEHFLAFRFTTLFLFSGTFFPLSSMPIYLQPIGWVSPLWHATELGREAAFDYGISTMMVWVHLIFLTTLVIVGLTLAMRQFERRLAK
jgi:ABC-type polysaccharide/polyol phosphate export permease